MWVYRDNGKEHGHYYSGFRVWSGLGVYSPPKVDRVWLRICYNQIPVYPIFYLPRGTINPKPIAKQVGFNVWDIGLRVRDFGLGCEDVSYWLLGIRKTIPVKTYQIHSLNPN